MSLHYNGTNRYLFNKILVVGTPLCLGNISNDFSVDNTKQTGLNGYVYDFSVDYNAISVDHILDIHKYLMKMNGIT